MERPAHRDTDRRSDAELLAATRLEPEAFGVFYHRNFDNVIGYFWRRTRDRDAAADLTAETFAAALDSLDRFDPARGNPSQWLFGIAANLLKKFWRRRQASTRARQRLALATPSIPTTGWEDIEAANARLDGPRLAAALEQLSARNREAVRLRVIDQLDYAEIGERLACKPGAARVRVLRGLRRLQVEFDRPASPGDRR